VFLGFGLTQKLSVEKCIKILLSQPFKAETAANEAYMSFMEKLKDSALAFCLAFIYPVT